MYRKSGALTLNAALLYRKYPWKPRFIWPSVVWFKSHSTFFDISEIGMWHNRCIDVSKVLDTFIADEQGFTVTQEARPRHGRHGKFPTTLQFDVHVKGRWTCSVCPAERISHGQWSSAALPVCLQEATFHRNCDAEGLVWRCRCHKSLYWCCWTYPQPFTAWTTAFCCGNLSCTVDWLAAFSIGLHRSFNKSSMKADCRMRSLCLSGSHRALFWDHFFTCCTLPSSAKLSRYTVWCCISMQTTLRFP